MAPRATTLRAAFVQPTGSLAEAMPAAVTSNPIETARALIARHRHREARAILEPLRGLKHAAAPVELLVAYSFLGESNVPDAQQALRRIPVDIGPALGIAVGRMLLLCDARGAAYARFRRVLIEQPAHLEAAAGAAEALSLSADPEACLAWTARTAALGGASTRLAVARLEALLNLGRPADAATLIGEWERSGADIVEILDLIAGRLQFADLRVPELDRMLSLVGPVALRRPTVATLAAGVAFSRGDADRAARLLADFDRESPTAAFLRHEIALERGDEATAAEAHRRLRICALVDPSNVETATALPLLWLRTVEHDSAALLHWTRRAACLAGSGLRPRADMLFDECVRLKNDMSQRTGGRGLKLAHALGALAAEARLGGPVAVRNGATHAHIWIAGRALALRLTSAQLRHSTANLFALEPGMLRWFAGFARTDVLVDVGANVGMFSVLAAGISGCRVIAIEPFSLNVADLEHNVAINGLQDRVTVLHAAATDRERVDTLYFGQSFAGAANQSFGRDDISEQYEDRDADREEVRGVSLDVLVARGEIPFPTHVKIDVDGLEGPVVEGMRGILADPRFKSLRMEIRWLDDAGEAFVTSITRQGFAVAVADDTKNLLFTRLPPA